MYVFVLNIPPTVDIKQRQDSSDLLWRGLQGEQFNHMASSSQLCLHFLCQSTSLDRGLTDLDIKIHKQNVRMAPKR